MREEANKLPKKLMKIFDRTKNERQHKTDPTKSYKGREAVESHSVLNGQESDNNNYYHFLLYELCINVMISFLYFCNCVYFYKFNLV